MFILNFILNTISSLVMNKVLFFIREKEPYERKGSHLHLWKDLVSCNYHVNVAFFGSCSKGQGPLAMPLFILMALVSVPLFLSSMYVGG